MNRALRRLVGITTGGDAGVWFSWQNLSESRFAVQGRAWLRLGQRITLRFEWSLWSRFAHADLHIEPGEGEIGLSVALPPVALWWAVEGVRPLFRVQPREIGWRFHGWTLFWHGWTDPNVWCSGTPWWRYFSLDVLSALFGKVVSYTTELESEVMAVPMPEGPYAGRATLEEHFWKRPRLPFAIRKRFVRIVTVHGIPDGRDKYDGIRESTHRASSIDAGLANFLVWILGRRRVSGYKANPAICEACRAAATVRALADVREAGTP